MSTKGERDSNREINIHAHTHTHTHTIVEVKKCQPKLEIWTLLMIDDCDVHSRLNSTLSVSLRNCWISSNQIG